MRFGFFLLTLGLAAIIAKTFAYADNLGTYAILTLPGTFFHELAHYLSALWMKGEPFGFTIVPDGNTMGSVKFHPNGFNAAFVALSPIILLPLAGVFAAIATRVRLIWYPVFLYLTACVWEAGTPSMPDLQIALKYPASWLVGVPLLVLFTYLMTKLSMKIIDRK
jgi:hypothetical protein